MPVDPTHTSETAQQELQCDVDGFVLDLCRFDWARDASFATTSACRVFKTASIFGFPPSLTVVT